MHPYYLDYASETFIFLDNYEKINAINNEMNRLFLILFVIMNGIVSYVWEKLIDYIVKTEIDKTED